MSVWFCIPSKRPPEEAEKVLKLWRERGYRIALWCDTTDECVAKRCDFGMAPKNGKTYPGYAPAVNELVLELLLFDPHAEWLITGGDDVEPDANHSAEEIADECNAHFRLGTWKNKDSEWRTFGVMQPTGDRYGADERHIGKPGSAYIDRVCGSPWMGREFCRRMYQGRGPLCEEYFHMGEDEELQAVAEKLGVLWQRPDLIHFHRHWARERKSRADMPAFLKRANSDEEWVKYKRIFRERQLAGFPGHEPLEA